MDSNPTIAIVNFAEKQEQMHPIVRAIFQKEKAENIDGNTWKLISKYFEADLQFQVFDGLSKNLEIFNDHKIEAFIFYFNSPSTLSHIKSFVSELQELYNPEMSALFYDGPSISFDKHSDAIIE